MAAGEDSAGVKASGRGLGTEARGGTPVGRRVRLPRGAQRPVQVFINGVEQKEGVDYTTHGAEILFKEPIYKEGRLGILRWLSIFIGLVGSYRRNEVVDVHFRLAGRTQVISDAEIQPD